MKVLVIGSGAREHAIAWKLAQSTSVEKVFVAPGNAGTFFEEKVENLSIDILAFDKLVDFVKQNQIDFTVVGPEVPLVAGIVDYFEANGCLCLGPSKACAQLEGSKAFAKSFMVQNHIPTARFESFSEIKPAVDYLKNCDYPIVLKADGLAAGKGVVIAPDFPCAKQHVQLMLTPIQNKSPLLVIEEFIAGEEVSFIVLCDGQHYIPLATTQDHKARDNGDKGPNTGGMGAYSPAPIVTNSLFDKIIKEVIEPTLSGMVKRGTPFKGFLYAGLMVSPNNEIKVLEYNTRFGDPETQPILMRLQSDFAQMCFYALQGKLNEISPQWDPRPALGVVLAANGYPEDYRKGEPLSALNKITLDNTSKIFHAGTKIQNHDIVTNGGRVLCVTSLGDTILDAQSKAYALVKQVTNDSLFYRSDIGYRAINRI